MRKLIGGIILLCMLIFGIAPVHAQSHKKIISHKPETSQKTDTVFTTILGEVSGDQSLPVSYAKSILDSTLIVRDQQNRRFPVISFSFGYQTNGAYDNDTTGMPEKTSSYISYPFYSNRLDSLWIIRIGNELKPGDQLYFDNIIVEGKNGAFHLASPLHFTIN